MEESSPWEVHLDMLELYRIILCVVTFILYRYDKAMVVTHNRRIPERVLIGSAVAGGAWGALDGMVLFRHKIRQSRFWIILIPSGLFYLGLLVAV